MGFFQVSSQRLSFKNTIPKTKDQIYLGVFHTVKSSVFTDNMTGKQLDARGKKILEYSKSVKHICLPWSYIDSFSLKFIGEGLSIT